VFTISVTVKDDDGGVSSLGAATAFVRGVGLVNGVLYVLGTESADHVHIHRQGRDGLTVNAKLGSSKPNHQSFLAADIDRIVVYGCAGNDHLQIGLGSDNNSGSNNDGFVKDAAFYGGDGDDFLRTGDGNDLIDGGVGDDHISSRGGNDTIDAGSGNNQIWSGDGNDVITAGSGNDDIHADGGHDRVFAGDGHNKIWSGDGDDLILAGSGNDSIDAGSGNDVAVGGSGDDRLDGGKGLDLLIGGRGRDTVSGDEDDDILIAGWTDYDSNADALDALFAEWKGPANHPTRVSNLVSGGGSLAGLDLFLNDITVHDDNDYDLLEGELGRDLFFYNFEGSGTKDQAKDIKATGASSDSRIDIN
jgi:Ca2+-binding RTX toxin-like protein